MNQETVIAGRTLLFQRKGTFDREDLTIQIGAPYEHPDGTYFVCDVEWKGIERSYAVAGADSLQALQLATDVEPLLKALSDEYDLFFPTGEPYFE